MENSGFNEYDIVVLLIILVSSLLSLIRGFIREIFSLASWIGAGIITFLFFPETADLLSRYFQSKIVASALSVIILYAGTLIILSIVGSILLDFSREVRMGAIDRGLGLIFGFTRGFIIVSIIHFTISLIFSDKEEPDWLTDAKTYSFTEYGSGHIKSWTKGYFNRERNNNITLDEEQLTGTLEKKFSTVFVGTIADQAAFNASEKRKIFSKVFNGLPNEEKEKYSESSFSTKKKREKALKNILEAYKNEADSGDISSEFTLSDIEMVMIEKSIYRLEGNDEKDSSLPWLGKKKNEETDE